MKSVWIALVDDWELKGNGLGDVQKLQFEPANRLMDLYEELEVVGSFNVEVMQQIAFEKYASKYTTIANQKQLWLDSIKNMIRRGMDVQLHLHPQWHNATFDGEYWTLDKRWDLSAYNKDEIFSFISQCVNYLQPLVSPSKIKTFRGGSWALGPPSNEIIKALMRHEIYVDMSIVNGIYYDGESLKLDYTNLECKDSAYYPDHNDIRKLGKVDKFVEIPTQALIPNWSLSIKFMLKRLIIKYMKKIYKRYTKNKKDKITYNINHLPNHIVKDPFGFVSGTALEPIIVDFSGNIDPPLFKNVVHRIVYNAVKSKNSHEFLIFENHSKNLNTLKLENMKAIIKEIKSNYAEEVKFVTLGQMADNLNLISIKSK